MTQQAQPDAQPQAHPDDDPQTEGIAMGLWLMRSPVRHDADHVLIWDSLSSSARGAHMAKARWLQATARRLRQARGQE